MLGGVLGGLLIAWILSIFNFIEIINNLNTKVL